MRRGEGPIEPPLDRGELSHAAPQDCLSSRNLWECQLSWDFKLRAFQPLLRL